MYHTLCDLLSVQAMRVECIRYLNIHKRRMKRTTSKWYTPTIPIIQRLRRYIFIPTYLILTTLADCGVHVNFPEVLSKDAPAGRVFSSRMVTSLLSGSDAVTVSSGFLPRCHIKCRLRDRELRPNVGCGKQWYPEVDVTFIITQVTLLLLAKYVYVARCITRTDWHLPDLSLMRTDLARTKQFYNTFLSHEILFGEMLTRYLTDVRTVQTFGMHFICLVNLASTQIVMWWIHPLCK